MANGHRPPFTLPLPLPPLSFNAALDRRRGLLLGLNIPNGDAIALLELIAAATGGDWVRDEDGRVWLTTDIQVAAETVVFDDDDDDDREDDDDDEDELE